MGKQKKAKRSPNDEQIVLGKLEEEHKDWLDEKRPDFVDRIGVQGKTADSAAELVRETIIPQFLARFFPNSSKEAREKTVNSEYQVSFAYIER